MITYCVVVEPVLDRSPSAVDPTPESVDRAPAAPSNPTPSFNPEALKAKQNQEETQKALEAAKAAIQKANENNQ